MSWLSGIAEKAEGFLNQIDQTAATKLKVNEAVTKQAYNLSGELISSGGNSSGSGLSHQRSSSSHSAVPFSVDEQTKSSPKKEQKSSGYASSVSSFISKATPLPEVKKADDPLIEFLNQSEQPARAATASLSRRSSISSLRSLPVQQPLHAYYAYGAANEIVGAKSDGQEQTNPESSAQWGGDQRQIWELTARVSDVEKTVAAKDAELAVLRIRLQEAEGQLHLKSQSLRQLEEERLRLLRDSEHSYDGRRGSADSNIKLAELESGFEKERQSFKRAESEWRERLSKLEDERSLLMQEMMAAQRGLNEEKLKAKEAFDQLKLAKYNLEANKQEFDEYKQKAQRILQSKEKLILTLKEGVNVESEPSTVSVALEELRQERDLVKEDLQQTHLQLYNLKAEIHELESQLAGEQRASVESQRHLQDQVQRCQQTATEYREQCEQLKQEHQFMHDEMRRQQMALQLKLQEKDAEITRLTNQVVAKTLATVTESELEGRIRALTENLIQKQTVIEGLQTDKHSLSLQLERLERSYREAESAALRASSTAISLGMADEPTLQGRGVPLFLRESPFDTGVTRGVKRAYSSIDTLSIRLGVFLRRYPIARVLIFVYMILLHAWVMIVLLTYTPEIHGDSSGIGGAEPRPDHH